MYNTYTVHTLDTTDYIDKIFTYLPVNAFINKGRCGIGGTTLELTNPHRCSLIVAPTVGILKDKVKSHPGLFIVYADISYDQVKAQLALNVPAQKIMTTPEGIKKVIDAATELGTIETIYGEWLLLLDECHTFISEDYRKHILRPFEYFSSFKNKTIITATPYFFSDERFASLDYHEIQFTDKLGIVTLLNCKSVPGTLNYILKEGFTQKGILHIFLNSVTEIKQAAERAGLIDFNIYCANDKDGDNMSKLGDMQKHFVEQPDKSNFKKVNFYTSRYFEGWDMFDEDATIILVTDVRKPHTKVSIGMKLKQAAGRLRKPATQIIHITNHHNIYGEPKTLLEFKQEYLRDAEFLLNQHKLCLEYCKTSKSKLKVDSRLEHFADIKYKTKEATLNKMKLDQQINQAYSNEMYNNIDLIKKEWENGYYNVEVLTSNYLLETSTVMKRKSQAQQLKEDYLTILAYREKQAEAIQLRFGQTPEQRIMSSNPLAYEASTLLDQVRMEELKYNVTKVQAEVIIASNHNKQIKLLRLLNQEFKQGDKVLLSAIVLKLQEFYDKLEIKDYKTGKIKVAAATHLSQGKWFDVKPCKIPNGKSGYENGYLIERAQFSVRIAA